MSFLTQNKTNWPVVVLVTALAVIIGGWIWFYVGKQEFSQSNLINTESTKDEAVFLAADEEMIADWKNYFNEKHNYQLKIPDNWGLVNLQDGSFTSEISPHLDYYGFLGADDGSGSVAVSHYKNKDGHEYSTNWYIDFYIQEEYKKRHIKTEYAEITEIYIAGIEELLPFSNRYTYLVKRDDLLLEIGFLNRSEVTDQIIANLKFITEKELIAEQKEECARKENPAACYTALAKELKAPHVCEEISSGPLKNSCYIKIAFDTKNRLACDSLAEIELKSLEEDWPELYYFPKRTEYLSSKEACFRISQEAEPWKTYQEKENSWEISHPNNFIFKENKNQLVFVSPENIITLISPEIDLWGGKHYFDFLVIKTTEDRSSLEDWIKEKFSLDEFKEFEIKPGDAGWSGVYAIEKVSIGENIPGYRLAESAQAFTIVRLYIKNKDAIMEFDITGSKDSPVLNQMLSTFRFLD